MPRRLDRTLLVITYFTVLSLAFITVPCIIVGAMQRNENSYFRRDSIVASGVFIYQTFKYHNKIAGIVHRWVVKD